MKREIELLAPAGSCESMRAAFRAGADAVYIGGRQFGARAYADNPSDEELKSAIDYAHLHRKSLYLTVNTLVKETELENLYHWIKPFYETGLDAAIVQDLGVFTMLRTEFPDLDIHASTQMTVTGPDGAVLLKAMGASRVVPARELSIGELKEICEIRGLEVEAFIHGALCYGYSGQCLISSLIGGRSGNRGRCAQACRLPYMALRNGKPLNRMDEPCLLSMKDLCGLDMLPAMLDAGVYSLKIEGRMKNPVYTAGVTSVYRKYVDRYLERGSEGYSVDDEDRHILTELFDRGGTTDDYLRGKNGRQMIALKERPEHKIADQKLFDQIRENYPGEEEPLPVCGKAIFRVGEPASLTVGRCSGVQVKTKGEVVALASNRPLTVETAAKQLSKTGGSGFAWDSLTIDSDERGFLPLPELNRLRREGLEAFRRAELARFRRRISDVKPAAFTDRAQQELKKQEFVPELYVYAENGSVLSELADLDLADGYYLALDSLGDDTGRLLKTAEQIKKAGKKVFPVLPPVFSRRIRQRMEQWRPLFLSMEPDGLLVRTLDSLYWCRVRLKNIPLIADYSLYAYNSLAWQTISKLGACRRVLPVELNFKELEQICTGGDELIAYGRLPVMYSANCIQKTAAGCTGKPDLLWLKDRKNKRFPVKNHCSLCFNTIYNSTPLDLLKDRESVMKLSPAAIRIMFTVEDPETAKMVTRAYHCVYKENRRTDYVPDDFTRGHYRRGIE